jgi:hypothetical protein
VCRSFAVFRRAPQPDDRLPRVYRDDAPLKQVNQKSSRRLHSRGPAGHAFYALAGKRLMCIVVHHRALGGGSFACNPVAATMRGRLFLEESCGPAPRHHRVLVVELLPDGVRRATVKRVGRPAVERAVRDNLLVADLRVRARRDIPRAVVWHLAHKRHELGLTVDESLATCRS